MKVRALLAITALLLVVCARSAREDADPCGDLDKAVDDAAHLRLAGQHREAEAQYDRALEAARSRSCRLQEARSLSGLGALATAEGRLTEGLRHLEQAETALSAFTPSSDENRKRARKFQARLATVCGGAYFRLGWLDEARDALRRARAGYLPLDPTPEQWATVLLFTARVNRYQGETRAAGDAVEEALELTDVMPATRASLYMEKARLALREGRFEEGGWALDRAAEAIAGQGNLLNEANVISDRAELHLRQGREAESLRWAEEALALAREAKTPDLNLEAHAFYLKSVALWKLGEPQRSRHAADAALALLEGARDAWQDLGLAFLANRQSYYRHRLDLAALTETPEDAWNVFEGYRAQGLLQSVSLRVRLDSGAPGATGEIETRRAELREAVRELDALEPAAPVDLTDSLKARFRDRRRILRELQADQGRVAEGPQRPEIGPSAAAEMVDGETLALVFAAGAEKLYVLALESQHGLSVVPLDAEVTEVEDQVHELVQGLDPYGPSRAQQQLDRHVEELSDSLLGPLAERLDGFRRLVIVADGPLEPLPFEVLRHPLRGQRASLDLCGQVVVLSACDTAGGRPVAGEGILGLPWAFLRAGAASVVASQWRVADEPTAELMIAFHRHLSGGAGPAAALRQARLELIDAGRPPSDWAAFVLLGDWRFAPPSSTFSPPSGPME